MRRWLLAATMALAGCAEGTPTDTDEGEIVGGSPESGYPAVGALLYNGEFGCSGTLVAPTMVLTAAHCLQGVTPTSLEFFIGTDVTGAGERVAVLGAYQHPAYDDNTLDNDIGVMMLAAAPAGVAPIPYNTAPMGAGELGRSPLFVGFGVTDAMGSGAGTKRSVEIPITEVGATTFRYEAPGKSACFGDSGGPALLDMGGTLTVVGVTSYGPQDCGSWGVDTRVDAFVDFLQNPAPGGGTPPTPPPPPPPGGDWCAEMGYYGDGICDPDCPMPDPDCGGGGGTPPPPPPPGTDWCADLGYYGDGICDPDCPMPDPDCGGGGGTPPPGSDWCADLGYYGDGICDWDCPLPDPDCG